MNIGQMLSAVVAMVSVICMIFVTFFAAFINESYFYYNFLLFGVLFFATYCWRYFRRHNAN